MRETFLDRDEAARYLRGKSRDYDAMQSVRSRLRGDDATTRRDRRSLDVMSGRLMSNGAKLGLGKQGIRRPPWKQIFVRYFFLRTENAGTTRGLGMVRGVTDEVEDLLYPARVRVTLRGRREVEIPQSILGRRARVLLTRSTERAIRRHLGSDLLQGEGSLNVLMLNDIRTRGPDRNPIGVGRSGVNVVYVDDDSIEDTATTIVHEFLHTLGHDRHLEDETNIMSQHASDRATRLNRSQIRSIRNYAADGSGD